MIGLFVFAAFAAYPTLVLCLVIADWLKEKYGAALRDQWRWWVSSLVPPIFFVVCVAILEAYVKWQMRREVRRCNAAPVQIPTPGRASIGRATIPGRRVVSGRWK